EDGIRDLIVTGVQTCALPIYPTGIDGIGFVITSSPSSPTTGTPFSSKAWASTPRHGPEISPAHTGCRGLPCTIPEHTSVPPLPKIGRASCRESGEVRGAGGAA